MTMNFWTNGCLDGHNDLSGMAGRAEVEINAVEFDWIVVMQSGTDAKQAQINRECEIGDRLAQDVAGDRLQRVQDVVATGGNGEPVFAGEHDIRDRRWIRRVIVEVEKKREGARQCPQLNIRDTRWQDHTRRQEAGAESVLN